MTSEPATAHALSSSTSSSPATERPQMSPELFAKFSKLIYDLSGIRFQENKAYFLSSKLQTRYQSLGLKSFEDYWQFLQSPSGRTEYGHMIDEITINETFFYRNEPQLQAFEKEVLFPLVQKRKQEGKNKIRMWSCAASTGDEAYTLALIAKTLPFCSGLDFEIVGTDICHDALQQARAGNYKKYAVRNIPADQLQRYFIHDETTDRFLLKDEIKQMATFKECNLVDSSLVGGLGKFDIALCRNVLIYFDDESKEKVLWNIRNALHDDGTVVMGHSENIYSQRHILKADKTRTASISYIKAPEGAPKRV